MKLPCMGILVALAACKGGASKARPTEGSATGSASAAATGSAAGSAQAPAAPDAEVAFVADDTGLVEVAGAGARVVAPGAITWCAVDARARVVWFTTDKGAFTYDLVDRATHPVIAGDLADLEMIVDWGGQQLGGESKVSFDVGARIAMTATPTVKHDMGCEGDRAFYCFGDDLAGPTDEVKERQKRADGLRFVDPAYIAALAARGAKGSLWTPPPVPPRAPAAPALDASACTEPDVAACGALTAIPAIPLWLVTTANGRGDFYSETRELWDPATQEFLHVAGDRVVRAKTPRGDDTTDYGGLRVSPRGALSHGGAVFDGTRVRYAPTGDGRTCGWTGGGFRVPGPTG